MKSTQIKFIFSCFFFFCFLFLVSCFLYATCQTNDVQPNSIKKYEDIIDLKKQAGEVSEPRIQEELPKDELVLLLPKLDSALYQNWIVDGEQVIWRADSDIPNFVSCPKDLLIELGIEKILKQTYRKENHFVDVVIYKFKNFTGAYSAYTLLRGGLPSKLKVGKYTSESDKLINFWKGDFFVDIHTQLDNDSVAKEFIVLASQDISKNIQTEQPPPVIAIQLPALNRIQGSEKYCLGSICSPRFFTLPDFDSAIFNLGESGGVITAEYQPQENSKKDNEKIILLLTRYTNKEVAQVVFNTLKEIFDKKKETNKEIDIDVDIDDGIVKIKNKKNDYTMLKQRGNLLAIAYGITNKKSGEKILELVPWPIEITKPIHPPN